MGYRFKKGSKVEVLYKKDVPSGSWWCAEILSGNGHTYDVRYDRYPPSDIMKDGMVERVPRKAIRPCPPPLLERPKSWVPGDVVEVFNNDSWKHAEISEVLDGGYHFVRLAGSPMELIAHLYQLRLLQSWQVGKWVVFGKDSNMVKRVPNEGNFSHQNLQPSGGVKKKKKQIEKEERCQRLVTMHAPQLRDDNQSIASSVGSCSPHNTPCRSILHLTKEPDSHSDAESFVGPRNQSYNTACRSIHDVTEDLDSHSDDDDESIARSVRQPSPRTKEALAAAEIHRQELHAYRSILVAFHASGPISWDQQVLMIDLRLMLNISTD